ncbi:MAG TPA: cold shock domain-containing protein [Luteibaculaceae bacterium]|nr:cold shock domain-containing protein [Luteibaculaceae bacterium]
MGATYAKQELEKKRARKKKEKAEKRLDRKSNNDKGKSVEDMFAYVDEMGRITDVPPLKQAHSPQSDTINYSRTNDQKKTSTGTLSLVFKDKGIGYITEKSSRSSIMVQLNQLIGVINVRDQVSFEKKTTGKGFIAVQVRKI